MPADLAACRSALRHEGSSVSSLWAGTTTPAASITPGPSPGRPIPARHRADVDLGQEIGLMVADEPGQPGPGGQGPVNVVAGPGVVGHQVPPVHGEQGSARQERADAVGEDLLEMPVAEVVQDLREHDEIETPGWPLPGDLALLDLPEGKPVRRLLGEVPVVAVRADGRAHVLADRCSHMSGPLSGGELTDGCLPVPGTAGCSGSPTGPWSAGPPPPRGRPSRPVRPTAPSRSASPASAEPRPTHLMRVSYVQSWCAAGVCARACSRLVKLGITRSRPVIAKMRAAAPPP